MKPISTRSVTQRLCLTGIVAAVYVVLTLLLGAFSFGPVQLRVSEALTLLPVLIPEAVPALTLGCLISNLFSPLGASIYDIVFGTLATLIAAVFTRLFRKNRILAAFFPVIFNGLIVGAVLTWGYGLNMFWVNVLTVAAGEAVSCYGLGLPLVHALSKIR